MRRPDHRPEVKAAARWAFPEPARWGLDGAAVEAFLGLPGSSGPGAVDEVRMPPALRDAHPEWL